jgi:hypothetical protein
MLGDLVFPMLGIPLGDSPHGRVLLRPICAEQRDFSIVLKQAFVDVDAVFDGQPFVVDSEPMLERGGARLVRAYVKNCPFGRLVHKKTFYSNH